MPRFFLHTIILTFALLFIPFSGVQAQSAAIKKMRGQATTLRNEIEKQKKVLLSKEKDIDSQLRNLGLVESRIKKQKSLVALLKDEVKALNAEIEQTRSDIKIQEERVAKSRDEYAEALRRTRKYGKSKSKLHFLFSSDDFRTLLRRYRYAGEYMNAHEHLAETLQGQILLLEEQKVTLEATQAQKTLSLAQQDSVVAELGKLEKEQHRILGDLKKQSAKVKSEIAKKQKELNKLNKRIEAEIDRILAEERAAKKRAEEAARAKNAKNGKNTKGTNSYTADAGVEKMSGTFLKNKKKLPVPITGSYVVVDELGTKNVISGKGNVQLSSNSVVIEGCKGAQARCIFEGEVTAVVNDGNYHFVIVRHGQYLAIYCNIINLKVSGGEKVKAGDIIGDVAVDVKYGVPRMQFQLRKEKQVLNPLEWLRL